MRTVFHINAEELNQSFLEALKKLYKGKEITVSVDTEDETSYLLSDPENKKRLLEARDTEEVYHFSPSDFAELVKKVEEGEDITEEELSKIKRQQ